MLILGARREKKNQNSFTKVSKNMLNLIHVLEVYFAVPFLLQKLQNSILIIVSVS